MTRSASYAAGMLISTALTPSAAAMATRKSSEMLPRMVGAMRGSPKLSVWLTTRMTFGPGETEASAMTPAKTMSSFKRTTPSGTFHIQACRRA
jgi:hypothetical protein